MIINKRNVTLTFAEARELLPHDLLEFATTGHKPTAFDAGSLERDRRVREYMRDNSVTDYFKAFKIVCLGEDPVDVFAEKPNAASKRRQQSVAQAFGEVLGAPVAKNEER